jgi:hypothetical protein
MYVAAGLCLLLPTLVLVAGVFVYLEHRLIYRSRVAVVDNFLDR